MYCEISKILLYIYLNMSSKNCSKLCDRRSLIIYQKYICICIIVYRLNPKKYFKKNLIFQNQHLIVFKNIQQEQNPIIS